MSLRFDYPWLLAFGLLAIPMIVLGWRSLRGSDALRRGAALALRTVVLLLMAAMLAGPHLRREHRHLTVIGLIREFLGSGTLFAQASLLLGPSFAFLEVRVPDYDGALLMILPPGGFAVLGLLLAAKRVFETRRRAALQTPAPAPVN